MKLRYLPFLLFIFSVQSISMLSCKSNVSESTEFIENENEKLNGKWKLQIKTPRGQRTPILFINGNVGTYEGSPIDIGLEGDKFSFKAQQEAGKMGMMKFRFDGILKDDKLKGEYTLLNTTFAGRSSIFSGERVTD